MAEPKDLKVDVMIQARVGSTRLPDKVLLPLGDSTILGTMLERVKRAKRIRHVVVLTTEDERDDPVVNLGREHNVQTFRGSEKDLLDRYYRAARHFGTDVIVRLTGDCPLMDPHMIDDMVYLFYFNWPRMEFLTNCFQRTYARGLDIEIFTLSVLKRLYDKCLEKYYREHVVPYVEENPEDFLFFEYPNRKDDSHYRLTVDTQEDYQTILNVYGLFGHGHFSYSEMIDKILQNEQVICNDNVIHKSYQG